MLGMALSRRSDSTSSRKTDDVGECAEAAGETHSSNAVGAGVILDPLEARGRRGGAEDEMPSPSSGRKSTPSVLFYSRLSSRVLTSPPKKLLGHLAVCGDRLRHRAAARTKNEENNEDDGVTLLESKAPLSAATGVSSSSSAVPVNPLPATVHTESKPEDRLLPSPDQEESCTEPRRRQEDFARRDQQLALQGRQQQQQQDATESEDGARKGGGGGVYAWKLEEPDEQDEPKQSIINKGDRDDAKGGTHTPDTEKPAPAEKTPYPLLLHTQAGFRDPARAHLREPERSSGHRSSTSTTASRRSSNGSENVPTPVTSFASPLLDAHGSRDIAGFCLTSTSSGPIPSSINITCHDGVKQEGNRKPHSTESDDRDGLNPIRAKYNGQDTDGGESSSSSNSSREFGNRREAGCGIEEDRIETVGGLVETGVDNPHLNDNSADHASSSTPAAAGRACESLGSVTSETASDHHCHHHDLSHETNASLHDDASPLLMLPPLADVTTTSAPEYSGGSASLSYASVTLSGGGSSASSAAVSSVDSSPALSAASRHGTFPPGARSAASHEAAAPASRFKKSVGMRLSGMLQQGRTVLKFGSAEKEAATTGRRLPRSRTVPNLTIETEPPPPDISAKNASSSSKPGDCGTSSSSESSRLSLFRRPSPLLLHQLCRRGPGAGHHPARLPRPDGADTSTAGDDVSAGTGGEQQVGGHQSEDLNPDAALRRVDAGVVVSETTAESTCPAGVLRRGREEADARREVGGKTDRTRETPRRVGGRSGRRQTTSGVLNTSRENGGEQVKCVRFGTMSIHVYAREARIRSRSSDSVDFAVTLDPPVPTDSYWRRIRECNKREYEDITDDFDDLGSDSAGQDESEDDEEEEGVEDGEEEVLRGYQIEGTPRHHRPAATGGSHHDHHVSSHDDFSDGVEHATVAARGRHRGPAVEELLPTPHTGEGPHIGTRGHETEGGLCVTGQLLLKNAGEEILGTQGGEGVRNTRVGHAYGSHVSIPLALDSHDLAKKDHHGRSPHNSHGGLVDTCPASNQEQRRRSDTQEHLHQHQIVEMKEQSNDEEDTAAATNALRSSYVECPAGGPGSSLESCKVREDMIEDGMMSSESGSSLESCKVREGTTEAGVMSFESTPLAHGHELAKPHAAAAPHARIRRDDSEVNSADWWRSLLNRSSVSSQECSGGIPHHEQLVTRGDNKGDIVEAAAAGQESAHTLIASSNNGGESSASKVLDENGTVHRGESGSSVPGSQDQQSLKNKENLERGLEEQRAPGLKQTQPTISRTRNSSAPQMWAPRASSHEETRWTSLSWNQNATKGHGTMEKGMTTEFTKVRRPFGVDPRRVLSDDHPCSVYSSTHGHSVLTSPVTRRREDEGELHQQFQSEVKKSPLVLKTEAVVPSSGHTQNQHVSNTDDSSSGFLHIYGMRKDLTDKDSQGGTRGEQPPALQREKISSLPDRPILPGESKSHGSRGSISGNNSRASTGVFSKNNSARSSHDLSSEYASSDLFSPHDWQSACGSSRSSSSLLKTHSTGTVNQQATAADGTAKQHDSPQGGHQLVLQQQISGKSDDFAHIGERGRKGSSGSMTSGGRRSLEEEVLNKATEEAIARSSSHLSAEEKENLRDILRGWCS